MNKYTVAEYAYSGKKTKNKKKKNLAYSIIRAYLGSNSWKSNTLLP